MNTAEEEDHLLFWLMNYHGGGKIAPGFARVCLKKIYLNNFFLLKLSINMFVNLEHQ